MTPSATPNTRTWLIDFILLAAIWGSSFLFMRIAVADFGPLATAAVRVAVASLFLLPLLWRRGLQQGLVTHAKPLFWMGVFNSALPFAFFAYAVQAISTGLSAILNATTPLFGALIAWLWLGDRLTRTRVLGLLIGFGGVAALAWDKASFAPTSNNGHATAWAVLACMASTLCYGIAGSYAKRHFSGIPPLVSATGSQLGALVALALPAAWFWPAQMPGWQAWLAVAVAGIACTGFAYILYFRLIERAGPARALAVTFLIPVFAVAYGSVFLGETLTGYMVVCGVVVVLGTGLAMGFGRKPAQ